MSRRRESRRTGNIAGKKILLVVTGGISAYKSAYLVRLLKRSGAQVRVVLSEAAARFVTPLTCEVLSGNPVPTDLFASRETPSVEHVELATWPDRIVVAPATADFISKSALGLADDLPSTVVCAARCDIVFAPAMNDGMWANPAVRRSVELLKKDGRTIIDPGEGELACNSVGSGRMREPEEIFEILKGSFADRPLEGARFLVTAGRTEEEIDGVRYISNRSSGRMGFAVAEKAGALGAEVTLIHGAVDIDPPCAERIKRVVSAADMKSAVTRSFGKCDVLVMAAAVSDYRPAKKRAGKIKRGDGGISLDLVPTSDILASLKERKREDQITVGFALESERGVENALKKIGAKGCDYMALNMIGEDTGFGVETNRVTLFKGRKKLFSTAVVAKEEAAALILEAIMKDPRLRKAR